jgi:hypothetical protein
MPNAWNPSLRLCYGAPERYRALRRHSAASGFLNCVPGVRVTQGAPKGVHLGVGHLDLDLPGGSYLIRHLEEPPADQLVERAAKLVRPDPVVVASHDHALDPQIAQDAATVSGVGVEQGAPVLADRAARVLWQPD